MEDISIDRETGNDNGPVCQEQQILIITVKHLLGEHYRLLPSKLVLCLFHVSKRHVHLPSCSSPNLGDSLHLFPSLKAPCPNHHKAQAALTTQMRLESKSSLPLSPPAQASPCFLIPPPTAGSLLPLFNPVWFTPYTAV